VSWAYAGIETSVESTTAALKSFSFVIANLHELVIWQHCGPGLFRGLFGSLYFKYFAGELLVACQIVPTDPLSN
jgi:hypothetical protein